MLNWAVVVSVASLLAVWPSQKIMEEIICVTPPVQAKIIVLMRKDVFLQWRQPPVSGCRNAQEKGVGQIRLVTGVRG
ncbi:hypothetical protein [Achromobacter marplatensis]|jgi:hypothetical protein|uniref:hypothetical protein n=1 Tax=Achromobacter marplatensis TaxID=470868 RepID=UPI0028E54991|nr:hypothetical protein [Achromobacter marplatensis]